MTRPASSIRTGSSRPGLISETSRSSNPRGESPENVDDRPSSARRNQPRRVSPMSRSLSISPLRPSRLQAFRPFAPPIDQPFRPSRERTTDDAIPGFARPSSETSRLSALASREAFSCPLRASRRRPAFATGQPSNQTRRSLIVVCESLPPDAEDRPPRIRKSETADLARRASATRSIPTITAAELSKNSGSDTAPSPQVGLVNISSFGTRARGWAKISRRRS